MSLSNISKANIEGMLPSILVPTTAALILTGFGGGSANNAPSELSFFDLARASVSSVQLNSIVPIPNLGGASAVQVDSNIYRIFPEGIPYARNPSVFTLAPQTTLNRAVTLLGNPPLITFTNCNLAAGNSRYAVTAVNNSEHLSASTFLSTQIAIS